MKSTAIASAVLGAGLLSGAGTAGATGTGTFDLGRAEHEQKCVICHGALGKGDGAYKNMLTKPATDLATLSIRNGGVFPFARVFETIEGTHELKAHGTREMPIWGREYRSSKYYEQYLREPDMDRSYFARSCIPALTESIFRLQAKK